jgi:hypothetical protein
MSSTQVSLRSRPEWRWGIATGFIGALAGAAVGVKGVFSSGSSTAAIGLLFVPVDAAIAAAVAALWGAALAHAVLRLRGAQSGQPALLAAAIAVAVALPAWLGYETWRGLALERAVREVGAMDAHRLDEAFERSAFNRDAIFLGAIAQSPAAGAMLLDRIAGLPDPALFEPMGSFWNVMGENRKGIAVMRLVARHRNASGATLGKLAAHPHAEKLLYEILSNPNTRPAVLERYYDSTNYIVEWGLALNPRIPRYVMERLSKSANLFTRINLTYNRSTPADILQRLANDPDTTLASSAHVALKRLNVTR